MNWKGKLAILLLCAVPAFTGYPVNRFDATVVYGITWAWAAYCFLSNGIVLALCGPGKYANIITLTALVTSPVIASGSCISYVASWFQADTWSAQIQYSAHYLSLCVTMLTVVPLALGLVMTVPMHAFEQRLLHHCNGVSMIQKMFLMALRVFNHIVYYVIPNIFEVVKEERQFFVFDRGPEGADGKGGAVDRIALILRRMTHVAGEGICAAIQYIPLWAVEISQLPGVKNRRTD